MTTVSAKSLLLSAFTREEAGTLLTLQGELSSVHALSSLRRFITGRLLTLHPDGVEHPRSWDGRGHEAARKSGGGRNHGAERRLLHHVLTGGSRRLHQSCRGGVGKGQKTIQPELCVPKRVLRLLRDVKNPYK